MRRKKERLQVLFLLFFFLIPHFFSATEKDSLDLNRCYHLALERSESMANQDELLIQAEEQIHQGYAALYPNIQLAAAFFKQETPESAIGASFFPSDQTTLRLSIRQPLFQGFRDLAALANRKAGKRALESAKSQARFQLFQDVAQAFYTLLGLEYDLKNFINEMESLEKRKQELESLKKAARARQTDIVAIDTSLANLKATLTNTRKLYAISWETFSFLTGLFSDSALSDTNHVPSSLPELETWLSQVDNRPDIQQAQYNNDAAKEALAVAKGASLPIIDTIGNTYLQRPGIVSNVKWDIQLNVTFPLFSAGYLDAQVREAESKKRQADIAVSQSKKWAEREIRIQYKIVENDREELRSLSKAVELSWQNYDYLLRDNKEGLVTNLEVIHALTNAHQIQRAYDRSHMTAKYNYIRLLVAAAKTESIIKEGR